eukprot:5829159-Pyramimonas_sp.AAC.2
MRTSERCRVVECDPSFLSPRALSRRPAHRSGRRGRPHRGETDDYDDEEEEGEEGVRRIRTNG